MRPLISIIGLVRPSVGWSVRNAFVKFDEMAFLNEMKRTKERRGERSDEEEGPIRRKEQL